jgi:hypothetical protein
MEGETFDTDEVRSSIARRLGIPLYNDKPVGRDVEGIVRRQQPPGLMRK